MLNCPIDKLSENVDSVPVAGHFRKIEASAAVKLAHTTAVSTWGLSKLLLFENEPVLPYLHLVTH